MSGDFLALAQPGVQQLSPYVPGKPVDELARELDIDPATIVKLASNENPLGPSPKALAAIKDELVGVDHPHALRRARLQLACDVGQRQVDDAAVEHRQREPENDDQHRLAACGLRQAVGQGRRTHG